MKHKQALFLVREIKSIVLKEVIDYETKKLK